MTNIFEERKIFEKDSKFMICAYLLMSIQISVTGIHTMTTTIEQLWAANTSLEIIIQNDTAFSEPEEVEETTIFENAEVEFLETQPVVIPRISAYEAGEIYYYKVTYQEKILMAKLVYVEARGECFEGKVAVAAVALNRKYSGRTEFNRNSIESVITQPGAFASISGVTQEMLDSVPECMEAVEAALKGWDPTRKLFEEGACFFYAPAHISEKEMLKRVGIPTLYIGNHAFHNELK